MEAIFLTLYLVSLFISPQEWVPLIKGLPLIDLFAGMTMIFTFMAVTTRRLTFPRIPENFIILGFFIAALMSHAAHTYLGGIIWTFQDIGKLVILYFLTLIVVDSTNKVRVIGWLIVVSAGFMALSGILQFYRGVGFGGMVPLMAFETIRIVGYGIFQDPNDVAILFVLAFPIILAFIFEKRGLFSILIASSFGVLTVWALWFTNSRSGIFAFVAALLVFFRLKFSKFKGIFITIIVLLIIFAFLPSRFTGNLLDESSTDRIIFWGEGNRMLKANPLFGVGYKMFTEYSYSRSAHSSFVNCYAELGLFGYFFWIALFYLSMYGLIKPIRSSRNNDTADGRFLKGISVALFASLAGFLVAGFFLTRTFIPILFVLFALSAKVRLLATEGEYFTGDLLPSYHIKRVLVLMTGSILFIYLTIKLLLPKFL